MIKYVSIVNCKSKKEYTYFAIRTCTCLRVDNPAFVLYIPDYERTLRYIVFPFHVTWNFGTLGCDAARMNAG